MTTNDNVTIGLLHAGIREDERMIITAAKDRGVVLEPIDVRTHVFAPHTREVFLKYDVILQRVVSGAKVEHILFYLEELGIPCINSFALTMLAKNKFATSMRLSEAGVPTPRFALAFGEEEVMSAIQAIGGFPAVIKPIGGTSWGRLMGKLNDRDAVEAILEHKTSLGVAHQSFYIQEYIDKPGRDIRTYTVNGETFAAIYRNAEHWIANTARGAEAQSCEVTPEITEICAKTQDAMGDGLLALDLFETKDGLVVNEVNDTMEFKNVVKITGIDIPGRVLDYCLEVYRAKQQQTS